MLVFGSILPTSQIFWRKRIINNHPTFVSSLKTLFWPWFFLRKDGPPPFPSTSLRVYKFPRSVRWWCILTAIMKFKIRSWCSKCFKHTLPETNISISTFNKRHKFEDDDFPYSQCGICFFPVSDIEFGLLTSFTLSPSRMSQILQSSWGAKWMGVGVPLSNPLWFKHHPLWSRCLLIYPRCSMGREYLPSHFPLSMWPFFTCR